MEPLAPGAGPVQAATAGTTSVKAPYGASIAGDVGAFESALEAAERRAAESVSEMARAAFEPLDQLNREAEALGEFAQSAVGADNHLSPSEIVGLTVQSQKFMFHSQLTANVANRTADGIQQLFRQQG